MRLAELQRAVQAHLLEHGDAPPALLDAVRPPAAERWRVYADAYRVRLVEVLAATFPALARTLGDDWGPTALGFVLARPSVHRSARDYGCEFAEYLVEDGSDTALRRLGELAAFEWALGSAFDAPDGAPLAVADLASVPPEAWDGLRLDFLPSLRRLSLATDAVDAWREADARNPGFEALGPGPYAPGEPDAAVDPGVAGEWLVWRSGFDPRFRRLDADEARALDRCRAGTPFGELCASLVTERGDAAALHAARWLRRWVEDGLVSAAR